MDAFSLRIMIYIIDLITLARLKLVAELPCLCLTSGTVLFFSGFFACHRIVFFGCAAIKRSV